MSPLHQTCYKLLTYLLTYSMQQSPSCDPNRISASQEIPLIYSTRRFITTIKVPTSVSILIQLDPVHTTKFHFLKFHFNIIHPSTPRSPKCTHSFKFLYQNPVYTSPLPILYLMYCHKRYLSLINNISIHKSCTQLKTHTSCYNINFLLLLPDRFRFSFQNSAALSAVSIEL